MAGVQVDAYTVALYKFDEVSVPGTGYATAVDAAAGVRSLTEVIPAPGAARDGRYTHIVNGPAGSHYARWFPGSTAVYLKRDGDATVQSMFVGSWSVECWIRPDVVTGTQVIFDYGGATELLADNILASLQLIGTNVVMFWEQGAGVNVTVTPIGIALVAGTWYHIAVTVDNSGATSTVRFYVNGALIDTKAGNTKAAGGTNTTDFWRIGCNVGATAPFQGAMKDMRFSTLKRSDAEVAASAAQTTYQHELDGSALILWRFLEEPDCFEETTYGYHARKMQGTIEIVEPVATDGGRARHYSADCEYAAHKQYEAFRSMFEGDWTWDAWFRMDGGYALADRGWWIFGVSGSELEVDNSIATDILSTANGRQVRCWPEHAAGQDPAGGISTGFTSTNPLFSAVQDGYNRHHVALTKKQNGANVEWRLYLDSVLVETQITLFSLNFSGGTGVLNMLRMGGGGTAGFSGGLATNTWLGAMDDMRWMNRALSTAEISQVYDEGGGATPNFGAAVGRRLSRYGYK